MKIINIKIEEFGCLENRSFDLSSKLNLITGENESGKSTLQAFIKFIFYGLPKKTNLTASERDRIFSWNSGTASGSLTFADDKGDVYTVYRQAVRKKTEKRESFTEECRIVDEKSGTQVYKNESPAEIFLGISAAVFESTAFVRQSGVTDVSGEDVGSALENILMSADESLNLEKALDRLEGARKLLRHKKGSGGLLSSLESERDDLSARLDKAKTNYERILSVTESAENLRRDALDKRRELDNLEILSTAVAKVEKVKRFDRLHDKESELTRLCSHIEEFEKSTASPSGFIPDRTYLGALREAAANRDSAKRENVIALSALENAEKELATEKEKTSDFPLSTAEIYSRGGAESICGELKNSLSAAEKKKKTGRVFLAVFGILLTLGLALAGLSAVLPTLLYAGIGAAAVSVVFLILRTSSLKASKELIAKTEGELLSLGAADGTLEERLESVKKRLGICIMREKRIGELETKRETARSMAFLRQKDLDSADEKLTSLIKKWKDTDSKDGVAELIGEAESVIERSDELGRSKITLKGQIDTLREGLSDINEADLRARVSPAAVKIYESGHEGEVERQRKYTAEQIRTLNEKAHQAERELVRLENESENPAHVALALAENRKKYEEELIRFDAVNMAAEALSEASDDIRSSVSPVLRAKAEGYMSALTDQKYVNMGIDEKYLMSARSEKDGVREIELLSSGTKDSAYLSLRLALLEVIFKNGHPFLVLDEALSRLDEKRAAAALRILASYCEAGGQCLLFTCHTREEKLLSGISDANIIRL